MYRIRDGKNRYPVSLCAKRDINSIKSAGISDCYRPIMVDNNITLINADSYFKLKDDAKYLLIKKSNVLDNIKKRVLKKQK